MASFWTKLRALLDPIARRFNLYTAYHISDSEFIGYLQGDADVGRDILSLGGYTPQYLSAAKAYPSARRPFDDEDLHDLSYRRVPSEHPAETEETELAASFSPRECQYHVHVFERDEDVEFFSHYETRPDFLRPWPSLTRLRTHYRPEYGETYLMGVTDITLTDDSNETSA